MNNLNCTGRESYIGACYHEKWNLCDDNETAGVTCIDMNTLQLVDSNYTNGGDVQLMGLPFVASINSDESSIPMWGNK